MVYNSRAFTPGAKGPLHLYAYGAYEINVDPDFSSMRLSLLDRGAAFAIAHVRGGGDMGRLWYERGKFLDKPNTFKDVIAVAEKLVSDEWTSPARLTLEGRSAGGMTVAAVANMRPDLFNVRRLRRGVPVCVCMRVMKRYGQRLFVDGMSYDGAVQRQASLGGDNTYACASAPGPSTWFRRTDFLATCRSVRECCCAGHCDGCPFR